MTDNLFGKIRANPTKNVCPQKMNWSREFAIPKPFSYGACIKAMDVYREKMAKKCWLCEDSIFRPLDPQSSALPIRHEQGVA